MSINKLALLSALILLTHFSAQSQGTWTAKAGLPASARQSAFSFELGGFAYVGTGTYTPGPVFVSDFWKYDPLLNSWTAQATYPVALSRAVAVSINGIAYAGTGYNSGGNLNSWYAYNPVTDQWSIRASFPGTARQDAFAVALNGKAYVGGGVFSTNPNVFQDLWEYNPVSDTWVQKNNMPSPRVFAAEFVINNKAYLIGGTTAPGVFTNAVHEYDPVLDVWTAKAPLPVTAHELLAFSVNGKGYVGMGSSSGVLQNQWYEYDPAGNTWQPVTVFPGPTRTQSTAFQIGNSGYIATGRGPNSNFLSDLWQFTPVGATGLQEQQETGLMVFPNPANDRLQFISRHNIQDITVFDTNGKQVLKQQPQAGIDFTMDVTTLPEGLYYVKVSVEDKIETFRVIIY